MKEKALKQSPRPTTTCDLSEGRIRSAHFACELTKYAVTDGRRYERSLSRRQLNPGFAEAFLQTRYTDARKSFATFVRQWGAAHRCGGTATGGNLTTDAHYLDDETAEVDGIR